MEIFLDSANPDKIRRWLEFGILDGVTTNPTVMLKDGGYALEERAREIAALIHPRPLSVEVFSNDAEEMLDQARRFVSWGDNIVVKIPVINEHGTPSLAVVRVLEEEGTKVNVTACLSLGQVILASKAGASFVSIFAGRVSDEGHDSSVLIRQAADWLRMWDYSARIIVGSIREAINLQDAALAGAHILTAPPEFLEKWIDHHYTRATVKQFNHDAAESMQKMRDMGIGETANPQLAGQMAR